MLRYSRSGCLWNNVTAGLRHDAWCLRNTHAWCLWYTWCLWHHAYSRSRRHSKSSSRSLRDQAAHTRRLWNSRCGRYETPSRRLRNHQLQQRKEVGLIKQCSCCRRLLLCTKVVTTFQKNETLHDLRGKELLQEKCSKTSLRSF